MLIGLGHCSLRSWAQIPAPLLPNPGPHLSLRVAGGRAALGVQEGEVGSSSVGCFIAAEMEVRTQTTGALAEDGVPASRGTCPMGFLPHRVPASRPPAPWGCSILTVRGPQPGDRAAGCWIPLCPHPDHPQEAGPRQGHDPGPGLQPPLSL